MQVVLIGSRHGELGAVNVSALVEILERIQPEVVFAEIPRSHHEAWSSGAHGTVESRAVARYAAGRAVEIVPVDLPEPDAAFFHDYEDLVRQIERTSPEYRRLVDHRKERSREGGFDYLNSKECITSWEATFREEEETVAYIGDPNLTAMYQRVRKMMQSREAEMLGNIHAYCATASRDRGVFLVGAAHLKALIEQVSLAGEDSSTFAQWVLYGRSVL